MLAVAKNNLLFLLLFAIAVVSVSSHAFETTAQEERTNDGNNLSTPAARFRRMRGMSSNELHIRRNLQSNSDDASYDEDVTARPSVPNAGIKNPTSPIQYLTRPHALAALSTLFSGRMSVPEPDENQLQQQVAEEDAADAETELVTFFGVDGFTQFSYGYDTAPPTMALSDSPTPGEPESRPITMPPTVDDLLTNESPVSTTGNSPPTIEPTFGGDDDLWTNENSGPPIARPLTASPTPGPTFDLTGRPTQDDGVIAELPTVGVHTPSLRPTNAPTDTCFPQCGDEEICRGGKGSCFPKCKTEKRCDGGDVCRADGYCDR